MQSFCEDVFDRNTYETSVSLSAAESAPTVWRNDILQRRAYEPNAFIGHELKLVKEVEDVFVSREDDAGKVLRVTAIVNDRDPVIRAAIYKREQAIMDEMRNMDFDFHIIAREGRPLESLITETGAGDVAL